MKTYLNDLKFILENGKQRPDRTNTGTIGVFGMQTRYNLRETFPAVTTKKLAWLGVTSELLWFIEGSGDERRLAEIRFGKDRSELVGKLTIWTDNANSPYWKPKAQFEGDLGRVYGKQWRQWQKADGTSVDQLQNLIDGLKQDPHGRRHILSAWNPGELSEMALPPCHCLAQFYVDADNNLSCQLYQRSCDMFLGVPFNIASYSLLTHMIAQVCGLGVGDFVHTLGDAHIYLNHVEQVIEQLQREPMPAPTLWINPEVTDINKFSMSDFKLVGYESHDSIKAVMAV